MIRETFDAGAKAIEAERRGCCRVSNPCEVHAIQDQEDRDTAELRIMLLREIVELRTAGYVEGHLVDLFSASAYIQIHDSLNEENQANLNTRQIGSAFSVVWALVERMKK